MFGWAHIVEFLSFSYFFYLVHELDSSTLDLSMLLSLLLGSGWRCWNIIKSVMVQIDDDATSPQIDNNRDKNMQENEGDKADDGGFKETKIKRCPINFEFQR